MSVDTAAQSVSLDWLLDSMQERKWARSSSTWSLRDSHISTRGVSLFSSIVSFPNGSLGRSFAQVGAAKPTTIATTVTNAAVCIFRTPSSAHAEPAPTGRKPRGLSLSAPDTIPQHKSGKARIATEPRPGNNRPVCTATEERSDESGESGHHESFDPPGPMFSLEGDTSSPASGGAFFLGSRGAFFRQGADRVSAPPPFRKTTASRLRCRQQCLL